MKISVLVISLVIGTFLVRADTIIKEDVLIVMKGLSYKSLLDMIKELITQGYPDAGIPVLDPYRLDFAHIDYEDNIFRILANITDGTFVGLGDFEMQKFGFTVEESMYILDFGVYFPSLNFTSDHYEMEGNVIDVFPLAGEGVAHIEIYGLNIWSKLYLKLTDNSDAIMVDRFEDAGFSVSRIVSKMEYDNNFDDIANAMAEDLLASYLNRFNKYLAHTYSPLIVDALNTALLGDSWRTSTESNLK